MDTTENATANRSAANAADALTGTEPFEVEYEQKRRFVRLEISSPMSMRKVRDSRGNLWPEGDHQVIHGEILNISAGGVLVDLEQALNTGDLVSMHFTLNGVEGLDNVLGSVKRIEPCDDCFVAGIEFVSRDYLLDH
ncbi:MAG: PilZ domain-containing protein, partial [candidate division Zixibacteria bacterium]|nr:PilZ domain-containing protein [candidate division Zixibacteria bacterium]